MVYRRTCEGKKKCFLQKMIEQVVDDIIPEKYCRRLSTMEDVLENFLKGFRMNVLLTLVVAILPDCTIDARILKTRLGLLEGITKEASHRKYFDAYYGIPFAEPPVGNLRFETALTDFQPPVEAEPWNGILNATQSPPHCPQINTDTNMYAGQEDCLFLHVFTPQNVKAGANLPVLFFICGGKFKNEYPTRFGPEYFMSRDIVVVMTNYRLGALGFLSTGDTAIAGNMALKDQLMAMKWTKENIYDFGGDPHRVTLMGHSSGSVCVHLHTMSPLSADYFHQVITQSGWGIEPLMFWDRDFAKGTSRAFASLLNCNLNSSSSLKECLLNKTAQELVLAAENVPIARNFAKNPLPATAFVPVIEDGNVEDAFLVGNPLHALYISNRKPWLLGIAENEGAIDHEVEVNIIELEGPTLSLPLIFGSIWTSKPNDVNFMALWMKTRFLGEEEIHNTTYMSHLLVSKMKSGLKGLSLIDVIRKYEGLKYVYRFDYRLVGGYSFGTQSFPFRFLGATHADEVPIMFKLNLTGVAEEDLAFGDEMITRWVNFVYSGNPNSPFPLNTSVFETWDPVSSPRIEFLRIDRNGGMEKDYFEEEYAIWRRLPMFSKYFRT